MEDASNWIELLKGGGNAALITLAIIAVKVANRFLAALDAITKTMTENHADVIASQEQIKRAIVSINPRAARHFEKAEAG
jgi:hypothetical protein